MDLVIINGNVHTMDYRDTLAEAVAIRDGRIVAVGSNADVEEYRRPGVPVIDASGQTVLPGFIEPHDHLASQPAWKLSVGRDHQPDDDHPGRRGQGARAGGQHTAGRVGARHRLRPDVRGRYATPEQARPGRGDVGPSGVYLARVRATWRT